LRFLAVFGHFRQKLQEFSAPRGNGVRMPRGAQNVKKSFPKSWETVNKFSEQYPNNTLDEIIHGKKSVVNENYIALKEAVVEDIEGNEENKGLGPLRKHRYINKIFFDLSDIGRSYMQQSSVVIDRLRPLAPYLDGIKKEVFGVRKNVFY
jgi:hypothetical protein